MASWSAEISVQSNPIRLVSVLPEAAPVFAVHRIRVDGHRTIRSLKLPPVASDRLLLELSELLSSRRRQRQPVPGFVWPYCPYCCEEDSDEIEGGDEETRTPIEYGAGARRRIGLAGGSHLIVP